MPGLGHGGVLASIFDIVLGRSAAQGRILATGTMPVRFLRPTPIGVEARFDGHAAATDEPARKSRATTTAGTASVTGQVVVEAEVVLVRVDQEFLSHVMRPTPGE
jgi:hypothetical protein